MQSFHRLILVPLALLVGAPVLAPKASAFEPVVAVETGVAQPVSTSRRGASIGGAIAFPVGARWDLGSVVAVELTTGPGFAVMDTRCIRDEGVPPQCDSDDTTSLFSWTVGPRFILSDGPLELFGGVRGGYYRGLAGRIEADAGGFAIETGLHYELVPGTAIGALARREQVDVAPYPGADGDFEFLVFGLSFVHRYGGEP